MEASPIVLCECFCRPRDLGVRLVLAALPPRRAWVIAGLTDRDSPLAYENGGVVLVVMRKHVDPTEGRALFRRVRRAVEAGDLGALRRLARPWERDDEFFGRAFGLWGDDEARSRKLEKAAVHALREMQGPAGCCAGALGEAVGWARLAFARLRAEPALTGRPPRSLH